MGGGIKVVKFNLFSCTLFISYLKTPENVIVGAGVSYVCNIKVVKFNLFSCTLFISYLKVVKLHSRCGEAVVPCSCALKVVSVGRRKPFLQIPVARDGVILHTYDTPAPTITLEF